MEHILDLGGNKPFCLSSSILLGYPPASFDKGVARSQGEKAGPYVQVASSITCPYLSHIILALSYNSVSSTGLEIKSSSVAPFKL